MNNRAKSLEERADELRVGGEYERAIAVYTKAIEEEHQSSDVYNKRGLAYKHKDEVDNAIADFNKAITLNHRNVDAYNNLGDAYRIKGKFGSAIAKLHHALTLGPEAMTYNNLGLAYYSAGDFDSAIGNLKQALEINGNYAEAYHNRGRAYHDKGDLVEAIADYNKAIEIACLYADAYHSRGRAYHDKGDFDSAIANYDKAVKINPKYAAAYHSRGNTYKANNEYGQAIINYDKAIEIDSKQSTMYKDRGKAYAALGQYDHAISNYRKAIELDPTYAEAIYNHAAATALQNAEKENRKIITNMEKSLEKLQKKQLAEYLSDYQSNVLNADNYEKRAKNYDAEFRHAQDDIKKHLTFLAALCAFLPLLFYYLNIGESTWYIWLSSMAKITLIISPFVWGIRVKIRDKDRLWALREDAYTKSILTRLIDAEQDVRAEMLLKYFDHHSKFSSTHLILEPSKKGDPHPDIIQNFPISPSQKSNPD